jgi:hypothetical protein
VTAKGVTAKAVTVAAKAVTDEASTAEARACETVAGKTTTHMRAAHVTAKAATAHVAAPETAAVTPSTSARLCTGCHGASGECPSEQNNHHLFQHRQDSSLIVSPAAIATAQHAAIATNNMVCLRRGA